MSFRSDSPDRRNRYYLHQRGPALNKPTFCRYQWRLLRVNLKYYITNLSFGFEPCALPPIFCGVIHYTLWMERGDRRFHSVGVQPALTHDTDACACVSFLWMAGYIRSNTVSDGLQVFLSSLGHCLNTRYKNGVLLRFTTVTIHEYRWDVSNNRAVRGLKSDTCARRCQRSGAVSR